MPLSALFQRMTPRNNSFQRTIAIQKIPDSWGTWVPWCREIEFKFISLVFWQESEPMKGWKGCWKESTSQMKRNREGISWSRWVEQDGSTPSRFRLVFLKPELVTRPVHLMNRFTNQNRSNWDWFGLNELVLEKYIK